MQRKTRQRSAVMRVLEGAQGPLSIEELHRLARDWEPLLGLTTVYRHLKNLIQDGEVSEVHLPDQATRVELTRKRHHHHFYCNSCHRVFDVEGTCPAAALDGATLPSGFSVARHELTLYGLCSSCQQPLSGVPPMATRSQ